VQIDLSALAARTRRALRASPQGGFEGELRFGAVHVTSSGELTLVGRESSRFNVQTISVRRSASDSGAMPTARLDRGHVVRDWELGTEQLTASAEGLEQTWTFARKPVGSGDLEIALNVSGQEFVKETPSGLQFADATGSDKTRYGSPWWIDASGRRTQLELGYHRGRILIRVPTPLLEASSFPAVLDPVISPEFEIDAPGSAGPSTHDSYESAVAFDGTDYLVAWTAPGGTSAADHRLVAARVSEQGVLLDPIPIELDVAPSSAPSVAFGAGNFMVAWQKTNGPVKVARVSPAGQVLDPNGVVVASTGSRPSIAHVPGTFLVGWQTPSGILASRLSDAAVVLDSVPLAIGTVTQGPGEVSVSGSSSQFIVAWNESGTLRRSRISSSGAVLDPLGGLPFAVGSQLVTSGASADFLLSYKGPGGAGIADGGVGPIPDGGPPNQLVALIAAANGSFGAPVGFPAGSSAQNGLAAASNGADFVISWSSGAHISAARVSSTGAVLDPAGVILQVPPSVTATHVACGPANCLVVWKAPDSSVVGGRISWAGVALDPGRIQISVKPNSEHTPVSAFDGTHFIVGWRDERGGSYATRLWADGGIVDDPAFKLGDIAVEAVAANGADVLFIGRDSAHRVVGVREAGGQILGNLRLSSAATVTQSFAALAASPAGYLVAWEDNVSIHVAGVDLDGGVIERDGGQVVAAGVFPAVASDGTDYLVAWDTHSGPPGPTEVFGSRFSLAGIARDVPPVVLRADPPLPLPIGYSYSAALAFDGTNYVHAFLGGPFNQLWVQRITPALSFPGNPVGLPMHGRPYATFDGTYDLVASSALELARFDRDGGLLEIQGIVGANSEVAVSSDRSGHTLLVGVAPYPDTTGRLVGWIFTTTPAVNGSACVLSADCASGYCVDHVCCGSACSLDGGADCLACNIDAGAAMNGVCSVLSAGAVCRPLAGGCDVVESCGGSTTDCPADAVVDAGVICRPSSLNGCDLDEACDGLNGLCPDNVGLPDGTPCDDGNQCTGNDQCVHGGVDCSGDGVPFPTPCSTSPRCHDDGVCDNYYCQIRLVQSCSNPNNCQVGYCDPADGGCVLETAEFGTIRPGCGAYVCQGGRFDCPTQCYDDENCISGYFCGSGSCLPIGSGDPGVSCGNAGQCASGHCADDVCCDTECAANACEACNLPGAAGTCSPVARLTADVSCAPYLCSGTAAGCLTTCLADAECVAQDYCVHGICKPKQSNGSPCSGATGCESGFCSDGVCCDGDCGTDPQDCKACSFLRGAPINGHCGPVRAGTLCRPPFLPASQGEGPCTACTGSETVCIVRYAVAGTECRASRSWCDLPESCSGVTGLCPADGFVSDSTPCPGGVCRQGLCADAGTEAGGTDAGPLLDAGHDVQLPWIGRESGGAQSLTGCGCRAGPGGLPMWLALAVAGRWARKRRR
jgi:hypothetical protein